jgi:triosephosphate isomerase
MTVSRTPLMAGNWKMTLNHLEAIALVQKLAFSLTDKDLDEVEVCVLPSFTNIRSVQTLIDGDKYRLAYGAQDVSAYDAGAYTGDVSAAQLAKLGCTYVCIGHSERRQYHHEDEQLINTKVKRALTHEIAPILCIGEPLEVRQEGTPENAQEVCAAIRTKLSELYSGDLADGIRFLYGGSVKASNVAGIMDQIDVDGALVGGASIDAEEFVSVCRYRDLARQSES